MIFVLVLLCSAVSFGAGADVYRFYQELNSGYSLGKTRRSNIPETRNITECPFICTLHDIVWTKKCSGSIVAPRWVLTAAHCVDQSLFYVTYNTNKPFSGGISVAVARTFRHRNYELSQAYEDSAKGVLDLHHDVGLVYTARSMDINRPALDPLMNTMHYTSVFLNNKLAKAYGFRRLQKNEKTEDLVSATLQLKECDVSATWYHCICATAAPGRPSSEICSLDSGGPVIYNGTMIGIVLMGPIECATRTEPASGSASVLLSLYNYMDVIEATIHGLSDLPTLRSIDYAPISAAMKLEMVWANVLIAFLIACFV